MFVKSIALALRESFFARLAVLPAIAMLACACVSEALAPEKNSSNSATNNPKVIVSNSSMPDDGFVSLDERILRSTIIARATMHSASAYARQGGNPSDRYFPMVKFTFDVHEYLKGNGGNTITANISVECTHFNWAECGPPEQEAIDDANEWLSLENNRWWESRESIIFLEEDNADEPKTSGQSAAPSYKFIPWLGDYATTYQYPSDTDGYSVLSERNRVWLPATTESSGASATSESRFMLGERPNDLHPGQNVSGLSFDTDISLSDLKARIKSIADMVTQGKDVTGYEECLRAKFSHERSPWIPYSRVFPVKSGQKAGTVITSGSTGGLPYYDLFFLTGTDSTYFEIVIEDDNSDPYDNYHRTAKTLRPLVAADYSVVYHSKPGILRLCIGSPIKAYTANPTANWTIRATAPAGTLHEAFFDPVAIGAAVGADGDNGALTPAAFPAAGGADAEIRRIDWDADGVKIEIVNPPVSLANHHVEFIALDGSIALRLDFGDAAVDGPGDVRTFRWGVCGQPWSAGDKLMLRMSESLADIVGATNNATCMGEPEPAPTATAAPR